MEIDFEKFQTVCRFMKFGVVDGTTDTFEPTCRRTDRIPQGHSWGKCDEPHCPYYGIKIVPGALFMDGKRIGEVESGRIVVVEDDEG